MIQLNGRLLAALLLVVFASLLVGCGGQNSSDSAAVEARIERERAEAATQAKLEEKVKALEADAKRAKRKARSSNSSSGSASTGQSTPSSANSGQAGGSWPSGTSAWTVILVSAASRSEAESVASRARGAGLGDVGVLYSGDHSSLRSGYWVAYTGVLSKSGATSRQGTARSSGFSDAYVRYVSAD